MALHGVAECISCVVSRVVTWRINAVATSSTQCGPDGSTTFFPFAARECGLRFAWYGGESYIPGVVQELQ
jgi:hypothetical protein